MSRKLTPEKARIFRITHRNNVPWILENGLHCRNSRETDGKFVQIGNPDLIEKRRHRDVPIPPGGVLSDYIPFYFTPFSPMMLNIKTGYAGVRQRANGEIVILVSSIHELAARGVDFVFTDRHAYLRAAEFSSSPDDLDMIDWDILQRRDFRRDDNDPGKVERYQAEALVYQHLPAEALIGIATFDADTQKSIEDHVDEVGIELKVIKKSSWYFQ